MWAAVRSAVNTALGKQREIAKTAAHRFVLWRRKMPTYAPSFLSENQPKDLCFAKIKMKLIWGIQTTQGAEGAGAERRRLRGVSEFLKPGLGVGGWEAREQIWRRTSREMELL